jgi:hypothetical protein
VSEDIKVQVVDYFVDWAGAEFKNIHCESIPKLSYYREIIDNKIYLPIPCFSVPYCYEDRRGTIINFFKMNL